MRITTSLNIPWPKTSSCRGSRPSSPGTAAAPRLPGKTFHLRQYLVKLEDDRGHPNIAQLVGHTGIRYRGHGREFRPRGHSRGSGRDEGLCRRGHAKRRLRPVDLHGPAELAASSPPLKNELIPLVKIAAKYGCGFWPHKRHHRSQWYSDRPLRNGLWYLPRSCRRRVRRNLPRLDRGHRHLPQSSLLPSYRLTSSTPTGCPSLIPAFLDEAAAKATLSLIDEAIAGGMDITFDVTFAPYGVARRGVSSRGILERPKATEHRPEVDGPVGERRGHSQAQD